MNNLTTRQLTRRATQISRSIRAGQIPPQSDAIRKLAEIYETLDSAPVKPVVVARLTVVRQNGWRTIVEVHSDASFHSFFHYYRQLGSKRSTKELTRTANRAEHLMTLSAQKRMPGLEGIALRMEATSPLYNESNPITSLKLRIIKKRAYQKLLSVSPDQLGLTKTHTLPIYSPVVARSR